MPAKVAFVNPPFIAKFSRSQRSPAVTKSGTLYYPMWLAYAAGVSKQAGHDIDLIDAPADGLNQAATLARICRFSPQLVVVDTSTPSIHSDVDFCAHLKKALPSAHVVLVGPHVSSLPEETLRLSEAVDGIAVGEYDYTIRELADLLAAGEKIEAVKGYYARSINNKIITFGPRKYCRDLDQIPKVSSIYKRFLDISQYFNPNALFPMVTITTSRGCPHRCIFCVYPQVMTGHALRLRSVENVVDEIEYISTHFPEARAVFFEDDTFPAIKKRCLDICNEIIRRDIHISWTANARVDVDAETLAVMKKAGCRSLCVGFESGSQHLLDNIKKKITITQARSFMNAARKANILVHGCFIFGLPGETRQTMDETLKLALELNPDTAQFYPVMVYPGTEAYQWYHDKGLINTDDFRQWVTPSGQHNTVIRAEDITSEELVRFCDEARRRFYLRPRYIAYKALQLLRHPQEIRRTVKSARTFFLHLARGTDSTTCQTGSCQPQP
ncbi:MAG: B12-binding domain-containing radical SAM protein [Desulfobulbus propionicus]|nr:MAG: B12-binding domain-containing radical SAM protein [Desulfobulbus propionicus]